MSKHFEQDPVRPIPVHNSADTIDTRTATRARKGIALTMLAAAGIGLFTGLHSKGESDAHDMQREHGANILRTDFTKVEDSVISLTSGARLMRTPIEQGQGDPRNGDSTSNVAFLVPEGHKLVVRQPLTSTKYTGFGACYFGDTLPINEEERVSHTYFYDFDAEKQAGLATEVAFQGDPKVGYRQGTIALKDSPLALNPAAPVAICALFPANQPIPQNFMQNGELPVH